MKLIRKVVCLFIRSQSVISKVRHGDFRQTSPVSRQRRCHQDQLRRDVLEGSLGGGGRRRQCRLAHPSVHALWQAVITSRWQCRSCSTCTQSGRISVISTWRLQEEGAATGQAERYQWRRTMRALSEEGTSMRQQQPHRLRLSYRRHTVSSQFI